ncbi:YbbR-like domain-containing protein [Melioribacteraceae bacterium 4301-Me]|uniref:CdaR family protein n=1 Tax=Pyranulibacter aquaticus TaxID=3163344 RepID=UPI003599C234
MKKKIITIILITFFSIGLWASVSLSGEYFSTITLPINIIDIPENYTLANIDHKEITLSVKAQGWELTKLLLSRTLQFDISDNSKIGVQKVQPKNFVNINSWISSTLQVVEITPDEIAFKIEKIRSKKVKIVPNLSLKFKQGYIQTSDISLRPDSIIALGAESLIRNIDSVKTEYTLIPEIEEPITKKIPLEVIDGITYSINSTTVSFDVQKVADKIFESIPVNVINVPRGKELLLFPPKINIVLRGGLNVLGEMSNEDLKPYVDFWTAYKDESGSVEPQLKIPKYTKLITKTPQRLQYIIKQL